MVGMVEVEKGYTGRCPRTWVRIIAQGRAGSPPNSRYQPNSFAGTERLTAPD